MEAKVDIRKLQLLNDRILQTIDALNQVRVSVHSLGLGMQHTNPGQGVYGNPYASVGQTGVPMGFGQQMPQGMPFYGQGQMNPYGLQHTTPFAQMGQMNPFAQAGQINPFAQMGQVNPFAQMGQVNPFAQMGQASQQPYSGGIANPGNIGNIGGLQHTSPDVFDPQRLAQTFPFAFTMGTPGYMGW